MAKIGYVRVSTIDQNEGRQLAALSPFGIDKWFTDKASGKNTDRPQFTAMLDYVREGDTIYIEDFSRLSRSVSDLLRVLEQLSDKGVQLRSMKESFDTSTPTGKLMLTMLAAVNEFEITNSAERRDEGIALAKANGVYKGRAPVEKPANWDDVMPLWQNRKLTSKKAMELLNLKRNTFYNFLKKENIVQNEPEENETKP